MTLLTILSPLAIGYTLQADVGAYTLTGQDVALYKTNVLAAVAGTYILSGQAVTLLPTRKITAAVGTYTYTGLDVNLFKGGFGAAGVGSYTLTGYPVFFNISMHPETGEYILTGMDVTLTHGAAPGWVADSAVDDDWTPEDGVS